jgi:hypothetical protein
MTRFLKPVVVIGLVAGAALAPLSSPVIALLLLSFTFMMRASGVRPRAAAARNVMALLFAAFFTGMAALSAFLRGGLPGRETVELGARILLVFNAAYLGGTWIGRAGFTGIIGAVPSERIALFLLLLVKNVDSLVARNRAVVNCIRSRLDPEKGGRLTLARYYTQNMIYGELRSYRNIQAALYTRLPDQLCVYRRPVIFRMMDWLAAACAAAVLACAILSAAGFPG